MFQRNSDLTLNVYLNVNIKRRRYNLRIQIVMGNSALSVYLLLACFFYASTTKCVQILPEESRYQLCLFFLRATQHYSKRFNYLFLAMSETPIPH